MKKILIITSLFLIHLFVNSQTFSKNFIDQNYIEVTGKAELEIIPDEIYLTIVIDEKDNKGKQSLEVLEKSMIKKLEEIGVDIKSDLAVIDFVSNFKNYLLKKNEIFTTKTFQLICHDAKNVSKVFIELEKLNISNISIKKLDHSKIEEYRKDVKIEAMKAAKKKAGFLLTSIDQEIGKALFIQEINKKVYDKRYESLASNASILYMSFARNEKSIPDIEFQKIKLEYEILARFEIK